MYIYSVRGVAVILSQALAVAVFHRRYVKNPLQKKQVVPNNPPLVIFVHFNALLESSADCGF